MTNLFIPYNLARMAEKHNFTDRCLACINKKGQIETGWITYLVTFMGNEKGWVFTPTYDQILNWLRDKRKICISVSASPYGKYYYFNAIDLKSREPVMMDGDALHNGKYVLYYEALNKAIEESFKVI